VIPDLQSRDPRYTGEWTEEEWEKYMKESMHDTPLMLLSEQEKVGMVASTFAAYKKKKNSKATVNMVITRNSEITMSRVAEEQRKNKFCQHMVQFFMEGKLPEGENGRMAFLAKIQGFIVSNRMVYKAPKKRECHPLPHMADTNTRQFIMRAFYDEPDAAHPGKIKMRYRILWNFWWLTLVRDVKEFCENCQSCHRVKPARTVTLPLMTIRHEYIWAYVSIDHVGRFPKTVRGYTHILVVIN
jgi:hypothetical protein